MKRFTPYSYLAAAVFVGGCAHKQPPTVALATTPVPTVAPLPTATPIVIRSNEPTPPALMHEVPNVSPPRAFGRTRARRKAPNNRAPTSVQRNAAPAQSEALTQSEAKMIAEFSPSGIAVTMAPLIRNASSSSDLVSVAGTLFKLRKFYRRQSNNPTSMTHLRASSNQLIVDRLIRATDSKLRLLNGNVPIEAKQVVEMNLGIELTAIKNIASALN